MLSAISDFLMMGVGTTHLHQKLIKTQEQCKENNQKAQNTFC
jgi:hypothetical protein